VLEHDQVAELQNWARGLVDDERPEVRAAAKAILLLADDLVAARSQLLEHAWIKQALEEQEDSIEQTLRQRLRRLLGARETRSEDRA
jgi:hypothetical protein